MAQQPQHLTENGGRPFSFTLENQPNQHSFQRANATRPPNPAPLQTSGHSWSGYPEQRFSYIETPIDDDTQTFDDERQAALLEEARRRYGNGQTSTSHPAYQQPHTSQNQGLPADPSEYPPEKQTVNRMPSAYQLAPPTEPHPAHTAPFVEESLSKAGYPPSTHPALQQAPPPPVSPGPLPIKNPQKLKRPDRTSLPQLTSPQFGPPPNGSTAPFSPYAATGPDLDLQHRPGQIPHPNMKKSKTDAVPQAYSRSPSGFHNSPCACPGSDLSTCFLGLTCPCMLYSRLTYRLGQRSRKQDPTDILGFHKCNGHCLGFTLLGMCGLSGLLTALVRGRVRHAYAVEGGVGEDFVEGCCCCCCALIQSEREMRIREEERGRWAGPSTGLNLDSYQRVESMRYPSGAGI